MEIFKQVWDRLHKGCFLLGIFLLLGLLVLEIIATVLIPEWRKLFYNILESKDVNKFYIGIGYFAMLMGGMTLAQSFKQYVGRRTALQCRTALTKLLQKKWVNAECMMTVDNPCQRINEDCRIATDLAVKVLIEIIISGAIVVSLVIEAMKDPYIVYAALIYTIVAAVGAMLFRRSLVDHEIRMQKAEADHRFSLSQISLGVGDYTSKNKYAHTVHSIVAYFNRLLGFTIFSASQQQFSIIVPWIILGFPYFQGLITLGEFMGSVATFELIVVNSTILIQLFPDVTRAEGSWRRIKTFYITL